VRQEKLALYREALSQYQRFFEQTLKEAAPITAHNIYDVESKLMQEEVRVGCELILQLQSLTPFIENEYAFVHQYGATCMSTSLSNGMIALGEPYFTKESVDRTHAFTHHIVQNTNGFGKPMEYRSIDDMHKYLKRNDQQEFSKDTETLSQRYRVELSNSLIDVIMALHQGEGRVVVQQNAHAQLAYELHVDQSENEINFFIRQRDPFTSYGSHQHRLVPLLEWRECYLWSPLKKIPSSMDHGFESLSASEVLEHLARYEEMDNLGVECVSGILIPLG
jgi:hypothetical protein